MRALHLTRSNCVSTGFIFPLELREIYAALTKIKAAEATPAKQSVQLVELTA